LGSFHLKDKSFELLRDKNALTYSIKYDNEEYLYHVKIERSKSTISFDYSIEGGTKLLTGIYNVPGDLNYKTNSLSFPGSEENGEFEPYILISKSNAARLTKLKCGDSTTVTINKKSYQLISNGDDSYSFSAEDEDNNYVAAKYFTFTDGVKNGTLVIGKGAPNNQVVLELTLAGSFEMKLSKIEVTKDEKK
jgi:hypothetical protein